jgi:glycerol-3-phosphate acyltransferase PlsY
MAISVIIIAVLSYALGTVDTCGLLCRYLFRDEVREQKRVDYPVMFRRHKWPGVGYALAVDAIRAIITVLIGGMLLKGAGFPSVGKLLAMLFALIGQTMPLTDRFVSRQDLVFPALLLLFVDWRLFLICVALGLLIMALTGNRTLMALVAAVAMPVFTFVLGGWWLKILLAAFCAFALIHCCRSELPALFRRKAPAGSRRAAARKDAEEEDE